MRKALERALEEQDAGRAEGLVGASDALWACLEAARKGCHPESLVDLLAGQTQEGYSIDPDFHRKLADSGMSLEQCQAAVEAARVSSRDRVIALAQSNVRLQARCYDLESALNHARALLCLSWRLAPLYKKCS